MNEVRDVKPIIETDRKPKLSALGHTVDPEARAYQERIRAIQMKQKYARLKQSKLESDERMMKAEEENRLLRLGAVPASSRHLEPEDVKPSIVVPARSMVNPGDTTSMPYGPENIISVSSDEEDGFTCLDMSYTGHQARRSPLPAVRIPSHVLLDIGVTDDGAARDVSRKKPKRSISRFTAKPLSGRKRSRRASAHSSEHARHEEISPRRSPSTGSDSESDSSDTGSESESTQSGTDKEEDYRPSASPSPRGSQRVIRSSQVQRSGSDSESEDISSKRRALLAMIREKRRKSARRAKVNKKASTDSEEESDSGEDLSTTCALYDGPRLRSLSVEVIKNRLDRAFRRHGLTKTTIQVLERWWPKTKVAKVHGFDTRQSYLLLNAVHAWWSRLLETIGEDGYKWPENMGVTPAWMLSRVREIVLQKEAAAERAERDMKTQGASIALDANMRLRF